MRSARTRKLSWIFGAVVGLALTSGRANADPVGFAVNKDSNDVSVVDLTTLATRATIGTLMSGVSDPGAEPTDVVVDPQSGWVYVSSKLRLIAFNGRLAVGKTPPPIVAVNTRDEGTGLALDAANRRLFMSHADTAGFAFFTISEFSIADPAQPVFVREIVAPPLSGQSTDLRFIAWDAKFRRLYVLAQDGRLYRTGQDNMTFAMPADGVINPAGMLADPSGGVWMTSRIPGTLFRLANAGPLVPYAAGSNHPRGLAWDPSGKGSVLVAVESRNVVRRFWPHLGAFDAFDPMVTAEEPQDVARTAAGAIVSVNRRINSSAGNVTVAGVSQPVDTTGQRSIALAVAEVARLTATPASHSFCWNQAGDIKTKRFTVQNTRLDRASMNLNAVQIAGPNPTRYVTIGKNTCNAASLKWSASCEFTLQFTAEGACVQPPPQFPGGAPICYWPSEVVVASTDGTATTVIPVRGSVALNSCPP